MTIGVIATLKCRTARARSSKACSRAWRRTCAPTSPSNKLYQLCKSRADANTYIVMEMYTGQDAIEAHRASDHFRAAGPKLGACLAGRPEIQFLDAV